MRARNGAIKLVTRGTQPPVEVGARRIELPIEFVASLFHIFPRAGELLLLLRELQASWCVAALARTRLVMAGGFEELEEVDIDLVGAAACETAVSALNFSDSACIWLCIWPRFALRA
ncbi:MAG: hypothetical protein DMG58_22140 [Acidobacteria bacterium]|nr:MAG: hypothetical protein DMG58_22140 [Acidobacteriota bacterium]